MGCRTWSGSVSCRLCELTYHQWYQVKRFGSQHIHVKCFLLLCFRAFASRGHSSSSDYDFFKRNLFPPLSRARPLMSHTYHWHTWLVILMVNHTSCRVGKRQTWETSKISSQIPPWITLSITPVWDLVWNLAHKFSLDWELITWKFIFGKNKLICY
jgi:hypothetical protein